MTRDEFREACLRRDGNKCIICGSTADLSVHHIVERRLWDDGGYISDNGATLCPEHHLDAEKTILSCEDIRQAAGITKLVLPIQFNREERIDKWGDVYLPSGKRTRGELFDDPSVQAILKAGGVLDQFCPYVKFPKIDHLPWSEGFDPDSDRVMSFEDVIKNFGGQEVIVSEKIDGENSSAYSDIVHARSIDGRDHPSRAWLKRLHGTIAHEIPVGWRICGENLFATHSIHYDGLDSFFFVFAIYDESNLCLSWDDLVGYASILGLKTVPVLYRGVFDENVIRTLYTGKSVYGNSLQAGSVVRLAKAIKWGDHRRSFAKFVRRQHVGTNHNWMHKAVVPNELEKL